MLAQNSQARGGRPTGRCDLFAEASRVTLAIEQGGRTEQQLSDDTLGDSTIKALRGSGIGQRLRHEEHVRRTR